MIPEFDESGRLPPGIHHATWTDIVTRYATSTHRRDLLAGLLDALRSLKAAGCRVAEPGGMRFRDYFQRDAVSKQPKGIIAIDLTGLA